jgi:hypothetical protein
MEIIGKFESKLPQQSGQGKNGTWVKQEFIIQTQDQFPRKVCIALWGDKIRDLDAFAIGDSIKASISVESREYNGKWYTDVKAWRVEKVGAVSSPGMPETPPPPSIDELPPFFPEDSLSSEGDDLPF